MATPEISIILPFYNAEKYFAECLESIITQTFKNIEILCINDGSTDNSLEILNAYVAKDARIRVFNQNNQGPAKARNIGLENAHGKYLMFCDADDTYEPTMCADMLNAIKTHNVDFVMCDVNLLEVDNNHGRSAGYFNYHRLHYKGITKLTEDLKSNINVLLWNKIFKIDIIKKYNMSFPNGYECDDDCFMWQYLSISHEFYGLDKKLYNYKILNNSIMGKIYAQKHIDKIADRIFAVRYFLHFLKNNDLLTNNSFFLDVVDKSIFWSLIYPDKKNQIQYLKSFKKQVFSELSVKDFGEMVEKFQRLQNIVSRHKLFGKYSVDDVTKYYFFRIPIFKKKKKNTSVFYYFFGIPFLRQRKNQNKKSYYLFGIKVFYKKFTLAQR